jgi:hypothetical protein
MTHLLGIVPLVPKTASATISLAEEKTILSWVSA